MAKENKRYAVVTGANKGIGFGVCQQLASNGIVVILTARDEKRGLQAVQNLNESGLSDLVIFHQLDVTDFASIAALADFIKSQFGKLDILVNNAGVSGLKVDVDPSRASDPSKVDPEVKRYEMVTQTYELAEECLRTNYYGTKRMVEALIPLLQSSDSPRIVNVSSSGGKLENLSHESAIKVLGDVDKLSNDKIDEVLNRYVQDFKEGSPENKGWPAVLSAYKLSKAAVNAYTRILAKKFPTFRINCVCPGSIRTDMNFIGESSVEEGAENVVSLALLPNDSPSGCFYSQKVESTF